MSNGRQELEILVCTIDAGIADVRQKLLPQLEGVAVLISHQYTDSSFLDTGDWPQNVRYITLEGKGLSKNRNYALRHAIGDIAIIADDDVQYVEGFQAIILAAYKEHPKAAAITFQAQGAERFEHEFEHTWRTVGQVSSWMITFRPDWVRERGLLFDEQFGLGAQYPQGEENIFLADIRKAQGKVLAYPGVIVRHADLSSGYIFTPERVTAKIAAVRRMYGWLAALATLTTFTFTKYKHYHKTLTVFSFVKYGLKGLIFFNSQ